MARLVALANFRTREILQPGDPKASGDGRYSVTRTTSSVYDPKSTEPLYVEVPDAEAASLIEGGLAREEAEHERIVREAKEAEERGPVPEVNRRSSGAPRGPASGLTVAPDPNVVGARAATARPTHELYGGGSDASQEPIETRHSAPVDFATSSPESLEGVDADAPRRRGRPPRE